MSANTLSLEQQMLSIVASVFEAYSVVLFLPDPGEGEEPETCRLAAYFSLGNKVIPEVRLAPGQGLVGWILRSHQPLVVPKFDQQHSNLDYYTDGEEAETKAFMGCPLPTGGALCVDTRRSYSFTDKEHRLLQMFAAVLDGIHRQSGAEAVVGEIPQYFLQLGLIGDLRFRFKHWSVFIKNFLMSVAEATHFDYCAFASVVVPGESYCIEAENHALLVQGDEPFYQSMSNGLAGWVFRNGQPVVQSGEDSRAPALFGTSENLPEFEAVLCLPVQVNKGTRGVVCLGHCKPHLIDETMRSFLRMAVGHLSLYLGNLYLRSRLRDLMTKAHVYREGPRLHDPDTSPYMPPRTDKEDL